MSDFGFTHVALEVSDIDKSIWFDAKYAVIKVVHRRTNSTSQVDVAWIGDLTRPFVIVPIQVAKVQGKLSPASHLGVACKTREEVDRLCNEVQLKALLLEGPNDWGHPVGYWAFIRDPNGHTLEFPIFLLSL
ncbi:bleomycin resistance protein [Nostoc minutum NIES-26]|uniref:Bleomycin resistance protein n=1 Tax=Nostoc minutum NIES-26 TaxID=1844469 RepID=A0A367Q3I3_9NOSO|nr:bleomycin resistance protein [Nostoc minutum NIES-26]